MVKYKNNSGDIFTLVYKSSEIFILQETKSLRVIYVEDPSEFEVITNEEIIAVAKEKASEYVKDAELVMAVFIDLILSGKDPEDSYDYKYNLL